MLFLFMTEISNRPNTICHGKALSKDICDNDNEYYNNSYINNSRVISWVQSVDNHNTYYNNSYGNYRTISWVERADKPHKCNVNECPLNRLYIRNKFWGIGVKALFYYECEKILKKYLPNDIVLLILDKYLTK